MGLPANTLCLTLFRESEINAYSYIDIIICFDT